MPLFTLTWPHKTRLLTIDDSDDDVIHPKKLDSMFQDVASEGHESSHLRKRIANEEDTWGYNISIDGDFGKVVDPNADQLFQLTTVAEMSCLLGKALSKTGINRIWPMVRDIIMINPVDKWSCVTLVPYGDNVIDMI